MLFQSNLQRLLKKKSNIFYIILLPILFNLIFIYGMFQSSTYKVGIVDLDKTAFTKNILDYLGKEYRMKSYDTEKDARQVMLNSDITCYVVLPDGITEQFMNGSAEKVGFYSIQESNVSQSVKLNLEGLLESCKIIGRNAAGNKEVFNDILNKFMENKVAIKDQSFKSVNMDVSESVRSLGFLAMGIMFMIGTSTTIIYRDRESGVFSRIIASSISMKRYFVENFLSFFVIAAVQIFVVILIIDLFLGIHYGSNIMAAFFSSMLFAMWCIALGIFVSSHAKSMIQANAVSGLINIPLLMLGGCLWSKDIMPGFLQLISNFLPTGWFLTCAERMMNGCNVVTLMPQIGLLVVTSAIFMIFSYRKYQYQ